MAEKISFKAKIEYVVYFKDTFGVVAVSTTQDIPFSKMKEDYDMDTNTITVKYTTTITGKMQEPKIGQTWDVVAHHVYNPKYKDQYQIDSINFAIPTTVADTRGYLESILTQNQADTLLETYPNIVQDVIDGKENVDLNLLKGFGEKTWEKTKDKIIENFAIADILAILIPLGISFKKIQKLLEFEGGNTQSLKETLVKNPYVLSKIDGISFKVVDKIATQMNPSLKESEERLVAFLMYHLENVGNESGNTWTTFSDIKSEVISTVPEVEKFLKIFIEKERENPTFLHIEIVEDEEKIGLKYFYEAEKYIIEKLLELNNSTPLEVSEESIASGIKKSEDKLGFSFTEEQVSAIRDITTNNFSILTSMAGCGKTTITRGILEIYREMGYSISLATLSAKAAIRSQEVTGHTATTIHRLLGSNGSYFTYNEGNNLECDFLILDECSMINTLLFKSVLKSINIEKTKLLFVGDFKQLSPISAGNTFYDLINNKSYSFMIKELTKIQRQAESSAIITDANKIREGINPVEKKEPKIIHGEKKDLYYIFNSDKASIFSIAVSSYISSIKQKGIENVVILSPRKKGTLNSTYELNKEIQKRINSENENVKFIHGDKVFWLNDRVLHLKNNYLKNVFNGEIGTIVYIDSETVKVQYLDKQISYTHEDINELDLGYSLTIHKVQGGQFDDVIIVLDNSHFMLLSNQLLYTAITRSKERCLLISQPFAFDKALEENKTIKKTWTREGEFSWKK